MTDELDNRKQVEVYNAAGRVAENIIEHFRWVTYAMQHNDQKLWWVALRSAYIESDFIFKEKDREDLAKLWGKINPHDPKSFNFLEEYTLKLRRLCKPFFSMGESQTGPAIWRR